MSEFVPRVEVREYVVTSWPEDLDDYEKHLWDISVHRTHVPDMWAVTLRRGSLPILTRGGNWSWKMPRNLRSSCYMPLDQALAAAVRASTTITINGWTVQDAVTRKFPQMEGPPR